MKSLFLITNINQNNNINFKSKSKSPEITKRALEEFARQKKDVSFVADFYKCSIDEVVALISKFSMKRKFNLTLKSVVLSRQNVEQQLESGASLEDMAKLFNVSPEALTSKLRFYGLWAKYKRNYESEKKTDTLVESSQKDFRRYDIPKVTLEKLISEGALKEDLAKAFGCSWFTIKARLIEYGLYEEFCDLYKQRKEKKNKANLKMLKEDIVSQLKQGFSIQAIANNLNCSDSKIRNNIGKYGLLDEYYKIQKERCNTSITYEELSKHIKDGADMNELAIIFNCKKDVVRDLLFSYHLLNEYNKAQSKKGE